MEIILKMLNEIQPNYDFLASDDYIADDVLDSLGIIQLVAMLETEFNVFIDELDIVPENFVNVKAIEELVKRSPSRI